ncbi:TrmH family RNA methyltransferase [Ilumatobacter nonamiensis]|uniref:TrmH family RNA methyltransferase n=1 Tax=Ilumatobacter nonamiensis TaxID=467093 RepID=UPI00034B695E|nr:RNA methyltransferase [Ilumatobacter nonamiensis]
MSADVIVIDDPDDERFAQFRLNERGLANRAQKRDDAGAGLFLAEGDLVVERALDAGCVPVAALVDAQRIPAIAGRLAGVGAPVYAGGDEVRRIISGLGMPQAIIALFERPARPSVAELAARCRRLVVLEAVDNPANVGSIIRNAAALGWDGLILDHTSADPLARRSLRVAMGTAFALPHARTTTLAADIAGLAAVELYAMTPDPAAAPIDAVEPGERVAMLIGSERSGLSNDLLQLATPVRIPMTPGVDSLNAAAATAVGCWELRFRG